jgi:hypothetical protein
MSWSFVDQDGIGLPNMAYANLIPISLLQKAFIPMVRMWDSKWEAVLGDVMPKMRGAPDGRSHFEWPLIVDPQMISEMHSPYGRTRYITTGITAEQWATRLTKMGFAMEPEEFLNEFSPEANFGTSAKMQRLTQICTRGIERRVELELVNYLYGNLPAIRNFSNQLTDRLLTFDLTSSANGMQGYSWNDLTNSDPFKDIDNAIEYQQQIGDNDLTKLFIGTKTAKILKNHDVILERIKYVRDVAGGTLEAFFGGLQNNMAVRVVKSQTFKENAANVGVVGTPGLGDQAATTWTNFNKYWYMRESNYEFAFLTSDRVGFTFTSKTNQFHNGDGLYTYSYVAHEPHIFRMRFELKFAPGVEDFANLVVMRKTVPQTV